LASNGIRQSNRAVAYFIKGILSDGSISIAATGQARQVV
jgi:hypothetical protein